MLSDGCSVLSVTFVHCGQMVGWIKMKLGMQVYLGPGHCVRWGISSPPPTGPIFDPYLLWPNGCMDQDASWFGGRLWPTRLIVRWGPRSPSQKKGAEPPKFSAHAYCGQTAGWIKMALDMDVGLSPATLC